jgi:nicotinate-nucleotide--dimethylbenzimidazole phosphoribosyltransferase
MVENFARGGAAVNVLARQIGARVVVANFGVAAELGDYAGVLPRAIGPGTRSITKGPAMSRDEALRAIAEGAALVEGTALDCVGTGEMGIGNTTAASALTAALTGADPAMVTGRGTGVADEVWVGKVEAVRRALAVNRLDSSDALGVLSAVGGFEIAGLVGVVLAGAARRVPVVLDGFIAGAAALVAARLAPAARNYMIAAHRGAPSPGTCGCWRRSPAPRTLELGMRPRRGHRRRARHRPSPGGARVLSRDGDFSAKPAVGAAAVRGHARERASPGPGRRRCEACCSSPSR